MIIKSILDTDLYKLTMQQAVLFGKLAGVAYEGVDVEYDFINRGGTKFPEDFGIRLFTQVAHMGDLRLTTEERIFLERKCRFLKRSYLDFLSGYRFNPDEVQISQSGGDLSVKIRGPWYRTVLWEVPLMALICEMYAPQFRGSLDIARNQGIKKGTKLREAGCLFADFGTRRRFSQPVQQQTVAGLIESANPTAAGKLTGTSNVDLARQFDITPIGTHAHEWFMAHAALFGYRLANRYALEAWVNEYDGDLGIALTDTFTTKTFFSQFSMKLAKLFDGVRHDSADPIEFAKMTIAHYEQLRIDPMTKTIVFSDGLTTDKAIEIHNWCKGKIRTAFGIGTHFTNDVGFKPLNIVIKLTKCNTIPVVKLSDEPGKNTGDPRAIEFCKYTFGL